MQKSDSIFPQDIQLYTKVAYLRNKKLSASGALPPDILARALPWTPLEAQTSDRNASPLSAIPPSREGLEKSLRFQCALHACSDALSLADIARTELNWGPCIYCYFDFTQNEKWNVNKFSFLNINGCFT